jgi:isoleucyl-tRNA synthetase
VPFLSESLYQNLVRSHDADAPASVHMSDWPKLRADRLDATLLDETGVVQRVVALGRSARNAARLKVRQPLARLLVRVPDAAAAAAVEHHQALIQDELNVKAVELIPRDAELVTYRIKPNLPVVGKRYGKLIPAIREFLASADGVAIAAAVARGETQTFAIAGQDLEFEPESLLIETESAAGLACAEEYGYLVGLDTTLTDELVREGLARELIRLVQDSRKQQGFEVSDRIALLIEGGPRISAAVDAHRATIMAETLAGEWRADPAAERVEATLGDESLTITLARQQPDAGHG